MYKAIPQILPVSEAAAGTTHTYLRVDLHGEKELIAPAANHCDGRYWKLQLCLNPQQATALIFGLVELDLFVLQASLDAPDVKLVDRNHNVLCFDPQRLSIEIRLHPAIDGGLRHATAAQLGRTVLTVAGLIGLWEPACN